MRVVQKGCEEGRHVGACFEYAVALETGRGCGVDKHKCAAALSLGRGVMGGVMRRRLAGRRNCSTRRARLATRGRAPGARLRFTRAPCPRRAVALMHVRVHARCCRYAQAAYAGEGIPKNDTVAAGCVRARAGLHSPMCGSGLHSPMCRFASPCAPSIGRMLARMRARGGPGTTRTRARWATASPARRSRFCTSRGRCARAGGGGWRRGEGLPPVPAVRTLPMSLRGFCLRVLFARMPARVRPCDA